VIFIEQMDGEAVGTIVNSTIDIMASTQKGVKHHTPKDSIAFNKSNLFVYENPSQKDNESKSSIRQ
jgi:hypothetical protein